MLADRARHREASRSALEHRQHLRAGELPPHPLHGGGAQGADHLPPRPRLRRQGRRDRHRRRLHRPPHVRAPLVRWPAPGRRGQGRRQDPAGVDHLRHDHAAELLPHVRQAGRHDRYGRRPRRKSSTRSTSSTSSSSRRTADGPRRLRRPRLPHGARKFEAVAEEIEASHADGPARPRRHRLDREVGVPLRAAASAKASSTRSSTPSSAREGSQHRRRRRAATAPSPSPPTWPVVVPTSSSAASPTAATKTSGRRSTTRVVEAGGLHIIGTERHESRRIDNQLRGRSGRQGDPGSVPLLRLASRTTSCAASRRTGSRA